MAVRRNKLGPFHAVEQECVSFLSLMQGLLQQCSTLHHYVLALSPQHCLAKTVVFEDLSPYR